MSIPSATEQRKIAAQASPNVTADADRLLPHILKMMKEAPTGPWVLELLTIMRPETAQRDGSYHPGHMFLAMIGGYEHERKVAEELAKLGVFVSHGDFYAMTVIERLGLAEEGLVRAGCAVYTSQNEIDRLVEGVKRIAR